MPFLRTLLVTCAAFGGAVAAVAAPPSVQILRLETVMHTAVIRRIATDRDGRWLATASDDKTVRIWEAATGRLVRILRPPIGDDREGMLFAIAMSPDGEWVATGGWTRANGTSHHVYIFRRESGVLVKAIAGHGNVINSLAWSPDGRFLATTLGAGGGLHVYRAGGFELVGAGPNRDCGKDSYGADFDKAGRLVVSCYDGMVRLYRVEANGLTQVVPGRAPTGGKQPYGVRFSPDGRRIAVGFDDTAAVALLDGETLSPLKSPDTSGVTNGSLSSVAFSGDGRFLYAAGRWWRDGHRRIRRWSAAGDGAFIDLPGAGSTVMDLRGVQGGGVAYGAFDPAWGILDVEGRKVAGGAPAIADFRDQSQKLRLSRDGLRVAFGYEPFGESPAMFDLATRSLAAGEAASGLLPARTAGQPEADWSDTAQLKLYGKAVNLETNEISYSLAIAPGGERVALGSLWHVRLFDRSGAELWKTPAPGVAWAINVSGDGRFVVAALGDGTLRWYRMSDGTELLAFFPHADRKRWVLWTPSGYYDAAPGAEDLIGWHVNRGAERAADFFPVSRFREQYYRPDVISKVLEVADEPRAVALANEELGRKAAAKPLVESLPPVVEVVSPADNVAATQSPVALRFRVRAPANAPATALRVRVNGQFVTPPGIADALRQPGDVKQVAVPVPERDSEIALFGENANGVSVAAVVRVKWAGSVVSDAAIPKPMLYVLAAGVGKRYRSSELEKLDYAAKDAEDFARIMREQKGGLYRDVEVKLLREDEATRDAIADAFDWLRTQVSSRDVGMLFLSGHGYQSTAQDWYFLPVDADLDRLTRSGIPYDEIRRTMSRLAGKAVFFIDACRAGNALGGRRRAVDLRAAINDLASKENGVVVYAASTGSQFSLESDEWKNGAFTRALIEGLSGGALEGKPGVITHERLGFYLSERVKTLTNGRQHPVRLSPEGVADFPIAVSR